MYPYTYVDSAFVSSHYRLFCELGYPQLDLVVHNDGSWSIIEMHNAPLIAAETKWRYVMKDIRHQEINSTFLKKMIQRIDPRQKLLWELEEAKTNAMELENIRKELHREDIANRAFGVIKKNEGLYDRVARNGMREANLDSIFKHIPTQQRVGLK